jgi:hypothetical protein
MKEKELKQQLFRSLSAAAGSIKNLVHPLSRSDF